MIDIDDFNLGALRQPVRHPGAFALNDDGSVAFGIDDQGAPVYGRLWQGDRAINTAIVGCTSSGTTNYLRGLLKIADESPLVDALVFDADGDHFGLGQPHAVIGSDEAAGALNTLAAEVERRLSAGSWIGPTVNQPLLLLLCQSFDQLIGQHARSSCRLSSAIRHLARVGPKAGLAFAVTVPEPTLECFGETGIRSLLFAGNLIALRSTSRNAGYLLPTQLPSDLWDLPRDLPGVGFLAGHPRPFRSYLTGGE